MMDTPFLVCVCGQQLTIPVDIVPAPGLCEGAWLPFTLVGVSANSADPEGALALAAAFFDDETQGTVTEDGMPVSSEVLRGQSDAATGQAKKRYTGDLAALLASCQTPVTVPPVLQRTFEKHIEALLFGEEDVNAAIEGIKADTALWLAER